MLGKTIRTIDVLAPPLCWAFVALSLLLLDSAFCHSAGEPSELPSIQRVLLSEEQISRELQQRLQQRALVKLSRPDFEDLVQKAAKTQAAKNPPRLVESRYRAKLVENAGLAGTCQWKILCPRVGPALLPLQPLNLALDKPRFENRDALIADFEGKGPALLVEEGGEHSVSMDWSARADARPEGLYFVLELPPASVEVLEFELPADREVSVSGGAVLSGPFPAEAADLRLWRIACGGRPGVNLWVRPIRLSAAGGPALFVRQHTVQTLRPDGLTAVYQFDLDVTRPGVRMLACEIDPELRPTEIAVDNLEKSELKQGSGGAPSQLLLTLREPLPVGQETLRVRCLAPLGHIVDSRGALQQGRPTAWISPGLRLVQIGFQPDTVDPPAHVVTRGETLEIRCHPDVRLENWRPGAFRLTDAGSRADFDGATNFHVLTLQGGGIEPEVAPDSKAAPRPMARLITGGVDFRARQAAWWQIGDDHMSLTLQITYEVAQGQLFQLPVKLPAGWDIETVELNPSRQLRNWNIVQDNGNTILVVELQQPLTSTDDRRRDRATQPEGTPARLRGPTLTVRLKSTINDGLASRAWPFPDAIALGARLREGSLAIDVSDLYRSKINVSHAETDPAQEEGPWGLQGPEHLFTYAGQPVLGSLQLVPVSSMFRARCTSDVYLTANRAESRLLLDVEAGNVTEVQLYVSGPVPNGGSWRVESGNAQLRHVERVYPAELAALATAHCVTDVATALAGAGGEYWRLTFMRPLRGHDPVVLHASRPLAPLDGRWELYLPVVLNAARMEGEVTLHQTGTNRLPLEIVGLREVVPTIAPPGRAQGGSPSRTFRYSAAGQAAFLRGPLPPRLTRAAALIERAELTTYLQTGGVLEHHFRFDLANWTKPVFPLPLPPGGRALMVRVDGRWVSHPASTSNNAGQTVLQLPVPAANEGSHRFAVDYATDGTPWTFCAQVDAPRPELPVEPLAYRHIWRLPPGTSPLDKEAFRRLPGPGEGWEPFEAWHWSQDGWPVFSTATGSGSRTESNSGQMQALADAVQALRAQSAGSDLLLASALQQLASLLAREGRALVVDAEALRQAGLTPLTPLALRPLASDQDQAPPWDSLGLTAIVTPTGLLLTSKYQFESWRVASPSAPTSEAVTRAVAEAAAQGRDSSGRFRSALAGDWLAPGHPIDTRDDGRTEWTAWEATVGTNPDGALLIVRGEPVARLGMSLSLAFGLAIALVLGLFVYRSRNCGRWRYALLLALLALSGLGVLFLPAALQYLAWGPFLGMAMVLFSCYVVASALGQRKVPRTSRSTMTAAAGATCLVIYVVAAGSPGHATTTPAAVTVYLIGTADNPANQAVLAPPDLLEQLHSLARPASKGVGSALLSANYDGKIVDGVAEFDASYAVHVFSDERVTLPLPLDGVQLQGEVWLDGAAANPVALAAPQTGFVIDVRGPGRHKIDLHFRVALTGTGGDQDIQFNAPRLLQNHLRLKLPPEAKYVQGVAKYGAQRMSADGDARVLDVDLGRIATPVHLHWYQPTGPQMPPNVQFNEAYLWDLRADAATLTALLQYDIRDGPVTALKVLLPADLEVRGAEARRAAGGAGSSGMVRLRDWKVDTSGNPRALELRFASPVRGEVLVQLDFVPAQPLPATVTLPVPTPQGTPQSKGSFLAYRVQGLEAVRAGYLRVSGVPFSEFAPFWPAASRPDPGAQADAYIFRREGGQGPVLTLRLRPQSVVRATQDIAIRCAPNQARMQAMLDLVAPNKDLAFVEWEIQSPAPVTIAAVTGPDVHCWSQTGNRLQIWLERAVRETHLELSGWLPLVPDNQRLRLELPALRVVSAQSQQTTVRLSAASGLGFAQAQPHNLGMPSDPHAPDQDLVYQTDRTDYGGTFTLRPAATEPDVRVLTLVTERDGRLAFTSILDYQTHETELRTVSIHLSGWDGDDVRLDAPRVAQRRERSQRSKERSWTLDLQPGATSPFGPSWAAASGAAARLVIRPGGAGQYRCVLSGFAPLADAAGSRMPNVTVLGAGKVEYYLALAGKELKAEAASGLTMLPDPGATLPAWKDEIAQVVQDSGTVWKVANLDWQMRLEMHAARPQPIVIFMTDQSAAILDQQHWLHEAVYTFTHEAGAELNLTMPIGAQLVTASLDGVALTLLQAESPQQVVALPGRRGVRRLALRWIYKGGRETVAVPTLDRPHINGAREGPVLFSVLMPPGYAPGPAAADFKPGLVRAAALDLAVASAELSVSAQLADPRWQSSSEDPTALAESQVRFDEICRRVRCELQAVGERTAPDLVEKLVSLQKQNANQSRQVGLDDKRAESESRPGFGSRQWPSEAGIPLYSVAEPNASTPRLILQPVREQQAARTWLAATAWLTLIAFCGLLACLPGVAAMARLFWPEQVALLGVATWIFAGPMLLVLVLAFFGLAARAIYLGAGIRRLFERPLSKTGTSLGGSSNRSGS